MRARTRSNASRTVVLALVICLVGAQPAAAPTTLYSIVDLSASTDGIHSFPRAINNAGIMVGRSGFETGANTRAVLWSAGRIQVLGNLPGSDYSAAFGINDGGAVVGTANTASAVRAVLWAPFAGIRDLGTLAGDTGSEGLAINNAGTVVGTSSGPKGIRAVRWPADGTLQNLGTLSGGDYSRAMAINASGAIVGTSSSAQGLRAVLWTANGIIHDLGILPGDTASEAFAINNAGYIVGYSSGPSGDRAVVWEPDGRIHELPGLPGGTYSRALAINNFGDVVGTSSGSTGVSAAVVWAAAANAVRALHTLIPSGLGVVLSEAHAINDHGQIAVLSGAGEQPSDGHNHQHEHVYRTYLLRPF